MRTVKTKADLARLAVSRGASATLGNGTVLNADRTRAAVKRPEPAAEAPKKEPPAPEPAQMPDNEGVLDAIHALAEQQAALAQAVVDHVSRVPPPTKYRFDISRDEDGFMKTVEATPIK